MRRKFAKPIWGALVLAMLATLAVPAKLTAQYDGGNGSPGQPYQLATTASVVLLASTPADWGLSFELTADIDLAGSAMTPIGAAGNAFGGTFDGNGFSITGLSVNSGAPHVGLFGFVSGVVRRVRLVAPAVTGTGANVGAVVGTVLVGGLIEQCCVQGGLVSSSSAGSACGGLVGTNYGGTIQECSSTATVLGPYWCGGLSGANRNGGTLVDNAASGFVTSYGGSGCAGGLVGFNKEAATVTNGFANSPSVAGALTGGLVGGDNGSGVFVACVCNTKVATAIGAIADLPGSYQCVADANLGNPSFFPGWNFAAVWYFKTGVPRLRSVNGAPQAVARGPSSIVRPVGGTAAVQLNAAESTDPDGDALTYEWTCPGLPNSSGAQPTLNLPAGTYNFTLTVSDGDKTATATVTVTVNSRPVARAAGPANAVLPNTGVALSGAGSSDADGQPLTYAWTCGTANPTAANGAAVTMSFPVGVHTVRLVVNDGVEDSQEDTISVTANTPPIAEAGPPSVTVYDDGAGMQPVTLDGSGSSDPDGQPLAYTWTCPTANPAIAIGVTATMTFPVGKHEVTLTVDDGMVPGNPDEDIIHVEVEPALDAWRAEASPSEVGRTSSLSEVKFYIRLPAGKVVTDVDPTKRIYLNVNGIKMPLVRDSAYAHKKCTVVADVDRAKFLKNVAVNGPTPVTVSVPLKTGDYVLSKFNLNVVAGPGPNLVFTERALYYFDDDVWK